MARQPRVLVTRPEPGASQTAARLVALGFEPVKLPLQETRPLVVDLAAFEVRPPLRLASQATSLPFDGVEEGRLSSTPLGGGEVARPQGETEWGNLTPDRLVSAMAVAFPSASAIRHAPRELLARLVGLPCFAVGEATADAAREAGFRNVTVAGGDAESLAQAIVAARLTGPVAYLCGKVRRPVFEQRLAQAGIEVVAVETYDTVSLEPEAGVADGNPVDFVLVYSANAASRLAEAEELAGMTAGAVFICISERVAEALGSMGGKILVAEEPNETAVLKVLGAAVKPAS